MEKAKNHWFKELEENVIAVGIIIMFIMETVNVICKFLAPGWMGIPEEISIFAYIWVCFFCASYCTKRGANIIVDALTAKYPKKLQNFLFMPVYGLNNALIPMIGFNYGAKNRRRIERITRYALLLALGIMAAGTLLFEALPVPLLRLFDASDAMLALGVPAIRIISASFCLAGISVILSGCMQGLGRGSESLIVALLRQLVLLLPAAVLLSHVSLSALWLAFPLAEACGLAAAVLLHRRVCRRLLSGLSE